jgi:hypothetical protein
MLFFIKNLFTKVISTKVQAMLVFASAIYLCIGENLNNFRYIAIILMLLSVALMWKLNKIYGILWLLLIVGFIFVNDIAGLNVVGIDDLEDVGTDVSNKSLEIAQDRVEDKTGASI